tara:strand:+ start:468 stop:875 length:408 start_codon:yes stop_codon:yes gene_type:complete
MNQFGKPQYGITKVLEAKNIHQIRPKVEQALQEVGFGVLTEIDVCETLKNKIDVDFKPYLILGACNPSIAYKALIQEAGVGLFLPCNIVISQEDEGEVIISAIDPIIMLSFLENKELKPIAKEVSVLLNTAFDLL